MSRYIDADALVKQIDSPYTEYPIMTQIRRALKEFINSAPSIYIVRCKECMHQAKQTLIQGEIYDMPCCKKGMRISNDNGFCSCGEREGE